MRRNNLTPCYHVIENRRTLCGVKKAFWQAIILYSGKVAAWDPSHVGFGRSRWSCLRGIAGGVAEALSDDMICGRCARILKSRKANANGYRPSITDEGPDEQEQERADEVATEVYNEWIRDNGLDFDEADYS